MTDTRTALVIGGGIAGPVAAMALQKAGIHATVYEAYDTTADGVGGGLSIAPNGLNALEIIGAADALRNIGTPMTALVMQSWTGKRLAEFGGLPGLPAQQFVWRADLYRALYDEAARRGIRVEHGRRLVGGHRHRRRRYRAVRRRHPGHRRHPDRRGRHPLHGPVADRPGRAAAPLRRPARLRRPDEPTPGSPPPAAGCT